MRGHLFVILGPSGAGKDSLIQALSHSSINLHCAQRVITRPSHGESEDYESVSFEDFKTLSRQDAFLFSWQAHGLFYGIRRDILEILEGGNHVILNGSRGALNKMRTQYPNLHAIFIKVDHHILENRLRSRGREDETQIIERIKRATMEIPEHCHVISNNHTVEDAVSNLEALIRSIINGQKECA